MQSSELMARAATEADPSVASHIRQADAEFSEGWICAGHVAMLSRPGDYFTIDLVGNLLVAVRGVDRIRVLSRVCLHRWASVVEGAGNARRFTCPFHAWSYGLDGKLLAAAFMDQARGFDRSQCRLPEVRSEIDASGLIFMTLSEDAGPRPALDGSAVALVAADAVAVGPVTQEIVPDDWRRLRQDAHGTEGRVHTIMPNLIVSQHDGAATLRFHFPNGPAATVVRTLSLSRKD